LQNLDLASYAGLNGPWLPRLRFGDRSCCDAPLEGRWPGRRNCASGRVGTSEYAENVSIATPRRVRVANERLRSCITGARLTISDVAAQVGVDPKTVERWIVPGRLPHRSHRWATASLLGTDEAYLWPELADERRTQAASTSELVTLYPNRGAIPGALWRSLLEAASDHIDVLVFAGLFLPDGYPEIAKLLVTKAEQGTRGRLTLGDPDSDAVRRRGEEERIGDGLAAL